MKLSELRQVIREVIKETSSTGTGASFPSPSQGAHYASKYFIGNGKENRATKYAKKLGYKVVKRPKRPSSTKLIDYLQ